MNVARDKSVGSRDEGVYLRDKSVWLRDEGVWYAEQLFGRGMKMTVCGTKVFRLYKNGVKFRCYL